MRIHENADRLSKRLRILYPAADLQLARELLELHEDKCARCQEDRLGCTVRPSCKDRNFLNALIEMGVNPSGDLDFCYSQHLHQLKRFVLEGKGRRLTDRRVPIKDLLPALKFSSIRQFTTQMTRKWRRHARVRHGDTLLVAGDNIVFHFDFARGLVEVNPWEREIRDFETFSQYVELLGKLHGVKAEVFDATLNWWILTLNLGRTSPPADEILADKVCSAFEAVHKVGDEKSVALQVEMIVGDRGPAVRVGDLRTLFSLVSGNGVQSGQKNG